MNTEAALWNSDKGLNMKDVQESFGQTTLSKEYLPTNEISLQNFATFSLEKYIFLLMMLVKE